MAIEEDCGRLDETAFDDSQEITKAEAHHEKSVPTIQIFLTATPKINLAQQQNSIPLVSALTVENPFEEDLNNIEIHLTSDPAFIEPKIWKVDRIRAGGTFNQFDPDVTLSRSFLAGTKEAIKGSLKATVTQGEDVLGETILETAVLAHNEWGGISYLPEIMAAYVLPNDPAVTAILRDAASLLGKAGHDNSLEGYQSKDRKRVWHLISALYGAIAARGVVYAPPPRQVSSHRDKRYVIQAALPVNSSEPALISPFCLQHAWSRWVLMRWY
ncbi:hypothetical protein [Eilatimonas milleporae]|uniref:hypothetical protein n=1 Tax=Eilatimonas milleporae TaxID=911205 RepID=UPI000EFA05BB|nr:hypothetical protein [Eilatimonas milleporae]